VDNTCGYARVSHSRQWSNYNFLFTMMCDVWVAICQTFVKRVYDDDDDNAESK